MKTWTVAILFFAVSGMFLAGAAQAATYKFTDKSGAVGLADDLQSIPEDCRATAVLISGAANNDATAAGASASPDQQHAVGQTSTAPVRTSEPAPTLISAQAAEQPAQGMPFTIRIVISIGVVIAAILVSVFLGKISAMHGHDKAIHILRISLSWLVVVYLVAAHAKDVMTLFKAAGSQVQAVSDESAKRGEKAAAVIKAMDAAAEQAAKHIEEHDKALKDAEKEADK